jgi:pre-mRNA-splicing helicase BRR2
MRYMSSQLPQPVRLVGLSHSLANARDVGEWLGAAGTSTFNFPPGVRPVPLEIHMHGLDIHNFEARMQVRDCCRQLTRTGCVMFFWQLCCDGVT